MNAFRQGQGELDALAFKRQLKQIHGLGDTSFHNMHHALHQALKGRPSRLGQEAVDKYFRSCKARMRKAVGPEPAWSHSGDLLKERPGTANTTTHCTDLNSEQKHALPGMLHRWGQISVPVAGLTLPDYGSAGIRRWRMMAD